MPPKPLLTSVLALSVLLLSGCFRPDPERIKTEVLAADTQFNALSQRKGPEAAFLAMIAPDGLLPGESARGPAAVRSLYRGFPRGGSLSWSPAFAEVAASGDMAYTFGHYELQLPTTAGTRLVRTGTYVTIWRRQLDGGWKFVLDTGHADPPRPPQRTQ
jgi:ketosteroid isomerase-like protein